MTVKTLIALGFGYVAQALAQQLLAQGGWRIVGTHRSATETAKEKGVEHVQFPGGDWAPDVDGAAWLISIPPDDEGCPAFRAFAKQAGAASWIGYLSSSGVYGDLGGGWAFEDTPTHALSVEAKRRVIAEAQWRDLGAHIFRLPGIYGPGRSAFDRLRSGRARRIVKPGQVFSRAHAEDIADALAHSIARPNPGRIYNIADDAPCPAEEVIAHAAGLLGVEPPPEVAFEDAKLPEMAQRFYSECKRLPNSRAKAELGWRPRYRTYREGLAAILKIERAQAD